MNVAFFEARTTEREEILAPQPLASSPWGRGQLRGMAVSGALARAAERAVEELARPDLRPVRWSLDLFRPAGLQDVQTSANVLRQGRRLAMVDAWMTQDGQAVARGTTLLLADGDVSRGDVWSGRSLAMPPPVDSLPRGVEPRLYFSERAGWTAAPDAHGNATRKQSWHGPTTIVDGEVPTDFQFLSSIVDVASVVTNWGDCGLECINVDVTASFARLPRSGEVGLSAAGRVESGGVVAATAEIFDREGVLGLASVTALGNSRSAIDPCRVDGPDR
jgi:Thioesterase-like superfamily